MADLLLIHATLATLKAGCGLVKNGALAVTGGRIAYAGPMKGLPSALRARPKAELDCAGRLVTPALIDCHTHLVFAGDRSNEFEARLKGVSYAAIARKGGGILSTVKATRKAPLDELTFLAEARAKTLMSEGVGTVEIKSGYGLDVKSEIKSLAAATAVGHALPLKIVRTFLGAHAVPPEYKKNRAGYVDLLVHRILPALKERGLVDIVDAYLERIAFTAREVTRLFTAAKAMGIPVRLHADQLSDTGGAALAAKFKALSADHLEYANARGIKAMGKSGTVAVLLPGAFFTLREKRKPPVDFFRTCKVPMALATDCNPGTSPVLSLRLMMNMGCTLFGLTPDEALAAATRNAAQALGLGAERGTLEKGKAASIAIWNTDKPAALSYWLGGNPLDALILDGKPVIV
jgi:imidazolonepropionase